MDAQQYDAAGERRRRIRIATIVVAILLVAGLAWMYRNWPEEHAVDRFFSAIQKQDFETAYGIWMHDPQWKEHTQKYQRYPFNEFYRDWGPGGEWGLIKNYEVSGSAVPKGGSGVVVEVIVNGRAERAHIWVEKSDKTFSFSPY